jgi:hypothetical protein
MEKIKQSISDFVEKSGIIEKIEGFMDYLSKPENIKRAIMSIRDVFANIVDIIASIAGGIVNVLDFFGAISDQKAASIQGFLGGAGDKVRSMGGDLSMVAAKERAGTSAGGSTSSDGGSKNYSSPMGNSVPNVSVKIQDRELFVVSYTGYNQGSNSDQQMTTKNISNPTQ